MILCRRCGVEVEDSALCCPLCREPLQAGMAEVRGRTSVPEPASGKTGGRVHRWLLEIFSLFALTAALVALAADFATDLSVSWSWYPVLSIGFLWVSSVLLVFCSRRVWIFLPAEIAAVGSFLFGLDRLTPGTPWFVPLAVPLTLLTGTILALTLVVVRRRRRSPFVAIAMVLLASGVFAMGLDLFLNRYLDQRWSIGWSAVVFACLLPVIALLFFLRSWLGRRQAELRKSFHL